MNKLIFLLAATADTFAPRKCVTGQLTKPVKFGHFETCRRTKLAWGIFWRMCAWDIFYQAKRTFRNWQPQRSVKNKSQLQLASSNSFRSHYHNQMCAIKQGARHSLVFSLMPGWQQNVSLLELSENEIGYSIKLNERDPWKTSIRQTREKTHNCLFGSGDYYQALFTLRYWKEKNILKEIRCTRLRVRWKEIANVFEKTADRLGIHRALLFKKERHLSRSKHLERILMKFTWTLLAGRLTDLKLNQILVSSPSILSMYIGKRSKWKHWDRYKGWNRLLGGLVASARKIVKLSQKTIHFFMKMSDLRISMKQHARLRKYVT